MSTIFSEVGNFCTGCLGRSGRLLLCLLDKKLLESRTEHSIIYIWNNGHLSESITINWTVATVCYPGWSDVEFLAIGRFGKLLLISHNGAVNEIDIKKILPLSSSPIIRNCSVIDGKVYIVGANHQMLEISQDLGVNDVSVRHEGRSAAGDTTGFEAVDGFGGNEIYAVGWEGEIWEFDGVNWQLRNGPTNLVNTGVVCALDDHVYITGQQGCLTRGRHEVWESLHLELKEDLWDICWFNDQIFMCSINQLYTFDGEDIYGVPLSPHDPTTFFVLDAFERALLSVGSDDVCLLTKDRAFKVV